MQDLSKLSKKDLIQYVSMKPADQKKFLADKLAPVKEYRKEGEHLGYIIKNEFTGSRGLFLTLKQFENLDGIIDTINTYIESVE